MIRITILLLLLASGLEVLANEPPSSDKAFMEIIGWLKSMDSYSYELGISSEMKAKPKEKQEQHSIVYSSGAGFVRYISSATESSFMNKKGMFKVNHQNREAGFSQFTSEEVSRRVMAAAGVADPGRLLDSVLLDKAVISSKKIAGDIMEYKLSYEPDYMIKSLHLRYDRRKRMLLSISYVLERYMNGVRQPEAVVHQTVRMSNYRQSRPAELEEILSHSEDLNTYLHSKYAGYNIHNL